MSLDNRIKATNILQELLNAFEEVYSDKHWLHVAVLEKDEEYFRRVNEDLINATENFKRLNRQVLKIMERGLDSEANQ